MWYGFGGRLRNTYFPAASVVVVRVNPETGLLIFTSTACITPPVGSLTVPCTVPAPPSSWAQRPAAPKMPTAATRAATLAKTLTHRRVNIRPLFRADYTARYAVTTEP